jgi:pseudouridine synthase
MKIRLQKILAMAGIASRRTAEKLIAEGKVSVDGKVVTEMGSKVDPQEQRILFEGKPLTFEEKKIFLLLNKPKGYVTTLDDPQGRPIVTSLLTGIRERVFPVGRLDLDTEGALLLTNDGELANRIIHPRNEVKKTYQAKVSGLPTPEKLLQLEKGIMLEGKKTAPARIRIIENKPTTTLIEITIHEGRKRQVRLMFKAVGHHVLELKRTAYGNLTLGTLPTGKYRVLTEKDIQLIFF